MIVCGLFQSVRVETRSRSALMPELSPEYVEVELPFIQQLQAMGWDYLPGDTGVPYLTEREDFRQVLLTSRLHEALQRINLDESGQPWLDDARINQAWATWNGWASPN